MNLYRALFRGSLWTVSMRWGIRALGMVSVVVLARLLSPEDFAIVAMAMMLVAAMSIFTEVGVTAVLIRDANITREDMDTAWTIKVVQGVIIAIGVVALAHPLANYFREPRVVEVVYVCAAALVLSAFENVGVVLFRKELAFAKDFRYEVSCKLVSVIATIALAFWLRSYWALALGKIVNSLVEIVLSYTMHPFRPRFSLSRYRRYLGFSVATILTSAAKLVSGKVSSFMAGTIGGASQMGAYNVAAEISSTAPNELTLSVSRAMFPTLARLRSERAELARMFLRVLAMIAAISIPMGIGLWVVTDDLVPVLLGPKWDTSRQLMKYLALTGVLAGLNNLMLGSIMIITGHHHRLAAVQWVRCGVIAACALIGSRHGVEGIAFGTMVAGSIILVMSVLVLRNTLAVRARDFLAIFWRPLLASLAMAWVVWELGRALDVAQAFRLALCVGAGALIYPLFVALLWYASGRPAGVEATAIDFLYKRLRKPAR